jgi:gluconokinase
MTTGYLVMGVSGCGKSTIGKMLAEKLGWGFFDADDFHPAANIAKMGAGIPLTDADRAPWLERLSALLRGEVAAGRHPVLACSALRQSYRDTLLAGLPGIRIVYLRGDRELIASRMRNRPGHFMPPALLDSQFAALEEPAGPGVTTLDLNRSVAEIVASIPHPQGIQPARETRPAK